MIKSITILIFLFSVILRAEQSTPPAPSVTPTLEEICKGMVEGTTNIVLNALRPPKMSIDGLHFVSFKLKNQEGRQEIAETFAEIRNISSDTVEMRLLNGSIETIRRDSLTSIESNERAQRFFMDIEKQELEIMENLGIEINSNLQNIKNDSGLTLSSKDQGTVITININSKPTRATINNIQFTETGFPLIDVTIEISVNQKKRRLLTASEIDSARLPSNTNHQKITALPEPQTATYTSVPLNEISTFTNSSGERLSASGDARFIRVTLGGKRIDVIIMNITFNSLDSNTPTITVKTLGELRHEQEVINSGQVRLPQNRTLTIQEIGTARILKSNDRAQGKTIEALRFARAAIHRALALKSEKVITKPLPKGPYPKKAETEALNYTEQLDGITPTIKGVEAREKLAKIIKIKGIQGVRDKLLELGWGLDLANQALKISEETGRENIDEIEKVVAILGDRGDGQIRAQKTQEWIYSTTNDSSPEDSLRTVVREGINHYGTTIPMVLEAYQKFHKNLPSVLFRASIEPVLFFHDSGYIKLITEIRPNRLEFSIDSGRNWWPVIETNILQRAIQETQKPDERSEENSKPRNEATTAAPPRK